MTPLIAAIEGDNPEIVRLLLDAGADPSVSIRDGWTPLHHAVDMAVEIARDEYDRHGRKVKPPLGLILELLGAGADASAVWRGRGVAAFARSRGHEAAARLFESGPITL